MSSIRRKSFDYSMTKPDHEGLQRLAESQGGYFRADQAAEFGLSRSNLSHHQKSGRFERIRPGLYRVKLLPREPTDHFFAAWVGVGPDAVISHESALELYELTVVVPNKIHMTVPRHARWKRPTRDVTLHTVTTLDPTDVRRWRGLPVTTPERTIADVSVAGLSREHVDAAVSEALDRGLTTEDALRRSGAAKSRRVAEKIERSLSAR
jgi:predicted transcriptional regulator of viral defense system